MSTAEGTWQWASGDPWGFESWHEGEPNNVDNEDCLSMSGQDGYNWMDLQCQTRWITCYNMYKELLDDPTLFLGITWELLTTLSVRTEKGRKMLHKIVSLHLDVNCLK